MTALAGNKRKAAIGAEFYPTPAWATRAMLDQEHFQGTILEPCCGDGALATVLEEAGYSVIASDLYDRGFGSAGIDARTITTPVDNVVTNPPFNIALDVIKTGLKISRRKVAMLLRLAFLESNARYTFFQNTPPTRVYIFSERLTLAPADVVVKGGGTISYAWFIWEAGNNQPPEIRWLRPGFKRGLF